MYVQKLGKLTIFSSDDQKQNFRLALMLFLNPLVWNINHGQDSTGTCTFSLKTDWYPFGTDNFTDMTFTDDELSTRGPQAIL